MRGDNTLAKENDIFDEKLSECLEDIEFEKESIAQMIDLFENKNYQEMIRLLSKRKNQLIDELTKVNNQIDYIYYLVYKIKRVNHEKKER